MPLFKDRIALEACPAKTAESIGYGATFSVLGLLLLSNFSEIGNGALENPIASSSASVKPTIQDSNPNDQTGRLSEPLPRNQVSGFDEVTPSGQSQVDSLAEISQFTTLPPTWHADLQPLELLDDSVGRRAFSALDWKAPEVKSDETIAGYLSKLPVTLPLVDPLYLISLDSPTKTAAAADLISNSSEEKQPIREIRVSSTETGRLTTRADNILRPQIPRPYRAQEIQRSSLLLPPRIQALKP